MFVNDRIFQLSALPTAQSGLSNTTVGSYITNHKVAECISLKCLLMLILYFVTCDLWCPTEYCVSLTSVSRFNLTEHINITHNHVFRKAFLCYTVLVFLFLGVSGEFL